MLEILGAITDFCSLIANGIGNSVSFLLGMFRALPNLLSSMFNNLPNVFQYGLTSLLGIIIMILLLKLVALFLSFK